LKILTLCPLSLLDRDFDSDRIVMSCGLIQRPGVNQVAAIAGQASDDKTATAERIAHQVRR
jgi:hypothetical protein